ncbi:MAG: 50S ribosomal protein L4 [archaeon]
MKANVYSIDGTQKKQVDLPEVFSEEIRPDVINRAFLALRSNSYQKKYSDLMAGVKTSADYFGRRHKVYRTSINIGRARLPKVKLPQGELGEVRRVPHSRGGRRAHPPKPEKIIAEKINKKERRKAIRSAIAATASAEFVAKRGHRITGLALPIVVDDKIEEMKKTKEVSSLLEKLRLGQDVKRAGKRTLKPGKGSMRGRAYKRKKSVLIIVKKDRGIIKAAKNIPGVDAVTVKNVNVELLAPGGHAGRLTVYSESAMNELKTLFK